MNNKSESISLVIILILIGVAISSIVLYGPERVKALEAADLLNQITLEPTATSTPTVTPGLVDRALSAQPTPTIPPLEGVNNARLVADHYCASGQGWQWGVLVEDGMGGINLITKSSCTKPD
jgi:hypothetical protein